jgi:hypothetical protein
MPQIHVPTGITEHNDKLYITTEYERQCIHVTVSSWLALTLTHVTMNIHTVLPALTGTEHPS